ncbi:MAG: ABC transporter permease [Treponema sp.]|jgi:ribose/xylose/arabinose/galactoside ABC-type transport system permease subunit|nr:ABC transporter permease [Treponema sp.]
MKEFRHEGRVRLVVAGKDVTMTVVLALVVLALVVIANPLTNDVFFTANNLTNLMRQMTTTGLLSLGMLFVILTGGIDLSVGSVVAFSAIFAAGSSVHLGLPVWVSFLLGIAAGAGWGLISGSLVAWFNLAPFVVTLAMMTTIRGLTYVYSEIAISARTVPSFTALGSAVAFGIPISTMIMVVFFVLGAVFLNRTPLGRSTIAIGGNRETVRLAGISVAKGIITAYVISGICAGTGGVLLASRLGNIQPSLGNGFELDAIAASVIGGANLAGGKGTVQGTVIGVLILAVMNNLLSLRNVESYWQSVLKGLIIIAVVLLHSRSQKRG